jgi:hypothetical protein
MSSVVGVVVGITLGLAGSIIGAAASLRRAKSPAERRRIIMWALALTLLITGFVVGISIAAEQYRIYLWVTYAVVLPLVIMAGNRDQSRRQANADSANSPSRM